LRRLQVTRDIRLEERRQAETALAAATSELASVTSHLESLERAQAAQVPGLSRRLAEVYKLGSGGYLRMLLSVDDMREMGRAYRTVAALASLDRERVRAHQSTLQSLREARTDLEARRAAAATLETEARAAARAAAQAIESRAAMVARIDAQRDLNAQLAGELEAARTQLSQTVSALEPGSAPALPFRPFRGALDWPASGRVVSRFGTLRPDAAGARNGVEIAVTPGTPVVAVHEGTVAYAAPFTGFGPLVILDHGNRAYTLYGHLATVAVTKGARVEKGGTVGTSGVAPGGGVPALYFEVRVDGTPTDPLQWLKPRTQRVP
jgi:septal ring factor EnvC (AmiA/AmiB activator)